MAAAATFGDARFARVRFFLPTDRQLNRGLRGWNLACASCAPDAGPKSLALLQELYGVAQLGRALVELARDGDFHFALHDLELGERPLRAHFLQPLLEKRELGTFLGQLREVRLLEELLNVVAA